MEKLCLFQHKNFIYAIKDNTLDILDISTTTLNQELLSINIPLKIMDASNAATAAVLSIQNHDVNITTFDLLAKSSNLTRIHSLNVLSLKSNRKYM